MIAVVTINSWYLRLCIVDGPKANSQSAKLLQGQKETELNKTADNVCTCVLFTSHSHFHSFVQYSMCSSSELSLSMLRQVLVSMFTHLMCGHMWQWCCVCVCYAGDGPCGSGPVSQSGLSLCSQRTLWISGDTCTSTYGKGTLLDSQKPLCVITVTKCLTSHPLC